MNKIIQQIDVATTVIPRNAFAHGASHRDLLPRACGYASQDPSAASPKVPGQQEAPIPALVRTRPIIAILNFLPAAHASNAAEAVPAVPSSIAEALILFHIVISLRFLAKTWRFTTTVVRKILVNPPVKRDAYLTELRNVIAEDQQAPPIVIASENEHINRLA
jgi:hypothetical protein